jgi:inward rectifier potassium channel
MSPVEPPVSAKPTYKSQPPSATHRFVTRDGRINVRRLGVKYRHPRDWYHWMMTLSWAKLMLMVTFVYIAINVVFALLYMIEPRGINNMRPGSFSDAFFFSVQTLATIGYGVMSPHTFYTNMLVAVESLVGIFSTGLMTGLLFSRFSRPTARMMFSHYAVIGPYEGLPTLSFRVANRRGNQILQAEIRVSLARNERTLEGEQLRRVYDLKLVRDYSSFFNLTWTVRHQIDANSPLYGETPESILTNETEMIVLLSGIDDVFGQKVHGRFAYDHEEVLFGYRFANMFQRDERNRPLLNYDFFDEVEPLSPDDQGNASSAED